jgi:hypothetical protein
MYVLLVLRVKKWAGLRCCLAMARPQSNALESFFSMKTPNNEN